MFHNHTTNAGRAPYMRDDLWASGWFDFLLKPRHQRELPEQDTSHKGGGDQEAQRTQEAGQFTLQEGQAMTTETIKKIYFTAKEVMDMFGFKPNIHGKYHINDLTDSPIKSKPFDRNAYMREYMRKRRKNFDQSVKKNLQNG